MRTRAFVRATPRSPVSVAFEKAGEPHAYGTAANISDGGACVWTSAHLEVGQEVSLSLSGARQPQPLQVPAVIAWGGTRPPVSGALVGMGCSGRPPRRSPARGSGG